MSAGSIRGYVDHFDGNDYSCTYIVAHVRGEPAGVIRCRWFADFARLEKMTIRKRFRALVVLNSLVKAATELCREKGYRVISGDAKTAVVPFWLRFGARRTGEALETVYGDVVPMIYDVPLTNDGRLPLRAVDIGSREFEARIFDWEGAYVGTPRTEQTGRILS
jgi:hypothetical protein